jgi:hypothetical protein
MQWHNEPTRWTLQGETITVVTDPKTDFWQKTHYGFIRDNGHFYFEHMTGDFTAEVQVTGTYTALYDQAGLMIRADATTWMKCGIEFVDGVHHASVVVTRDYSDWSVVPLPASPLTLWIRVRRQSGDIEVQYSLNGHAYHMLRVAHLTTANPLQVGMMCASPEGDGFSVTFDAFSVQQIGPPDETDHDSADCSTAEDR